MTYNKLVRDNIPAIIKNKGGTPVTRILDTADYKTALLEKLVEEAQELLESPGDIDERADIAEVLKAIDSFFEFKADAIEATRLEKVRQRGAFSNKIFLENVI